MFFRSSLSRPFAPSLLYFNVVRPCSKMETKGRGAGYWRRVENQKKFLDSLATQLGFSSPLDFLKVKTHKVIVAHGGSSLLKQYKNSWEMLLSVYPTEKWPPLPPVIPRYFWDKKENQHTFWESIIAQLKLTEVKQLETIPTSKLLELGGAGVLAKHTNRIQALTYIYPEIEWSPHTTKHKANHYWDSTTNQRNFLESIQSNIGINSTEEWCNVKTNILKQNGGSALLSKYPSFKAALTSIYPSISWEKVYEEKIKTPRNHWHSVENQRKYLDSLALSLRLPDLHAWRNVTLSSHPRLRYISQQYNSFFEALQTIYPDYPWEAVESGTRVPYMYWNSLDNQKTFMEATRKKLNFAIEEWIQQPVSTVMEMGGAGLLSNYSNFIELLRAVYPDVVWEESGRGQYPRGHWSDPNNVTKFLHQLKEDLRIHSEEDWSRISMNQIKQQGGSGLLRKYGSLHKVLSVGFPEKTWDVAHFSRRDKRSEQRWLLIRLRELFPSEEIIEDFVHDELTRISGQQVEIDIFFPHHNIGFEYNGKHHYHELTAFGPLEMYQERDKEKKELCEKHDVELLAIPYSWDGSINDLLTFTKEGKRFLSLLQTTCPRTDTHKPKE